MSQEETKEAKQNEKETQQAGTPQDEAGYNYF